MGGATEMENLAIVEMICDRLDARSALPDGRARRELITFVKDRPGHDLRYAIDFSKLQSELGWSPEESLDTGVEKTIQWYLGSSEWVDRVRSGEYKNWMRRQYDG